ncbi:MutS-related protein [Terrimonas pollutisoli]|uniref:MutS-related protein n=1 Tax=Terrimonas pollutisoli TaxID=3034147 RepID=UPI0023EBB45F|nr:DNA mismatch repair protein MutS [Terrimonas sp. H1YJ31]
MPLITYQSLLSKYTARANALTQQLRWFSFFRLLFFCGFIYLGFKSIQTGDRILIISTIVSLIIFLLFIRVYDKLQSSASFYKELAKLNSNEIDFLKGQPSVYADGKEYTDPHHPYSYDLDLFGEGGLFAWLNRTSTSYGKEALAKSLLHPDLKQINERQDAIEELAHKLDFRQHLQAHGSLLDTKEKELQQLKAWLTAKPGFTNRTVYWLLMLFPFATITCLVYYFASEQEAALNTFYYLFIVNLIIAGVFAKKISAHLSVSTSVTKILQQFAGQLHQLETQSFQSSLLKQLQQGLKTGEIMASRSIARLASLFNYLETIINLVVSILLNGLFLFHIHVLYALEKWKQKNGNHVLPWLELLGEAEALNCFANLSFNNKSFCRPQLTQRETLVAINMGHPLIRSEKRITNSISFAEHRFVILTGSNMSGKSTFLRTLGINLVLARAGSNTCADQFSFYPYAVHVSMRITDSLQDSESFFYAELKRLHSIIEQLNEGEKTFVILDEILRGTNSNDKHNGTIGLIRKLVSANACGIIATHDLTVSKLAEENNGYISNKCFESEIINDELVFDYKLKDGVCTKLSASFLMKKMGVID